MKHHFRQIIGILLSLMLYLSCVFVPVAALETIPKEEIHENAMIYASCNHSDKVESFAYYANYRYGGPTMCMYDEYWQVYCNVCEKVVETWLKTPTYVSHMWDKCPYGNNICDYCNNCHYHSRNP